MPTLQISDSDFSTLRDTMSAAKPIHDKLSNGDTNLTANEAVTYSRAFDQMKSLIDRT